jgi:hypothetical protein
MNRVKQQCEKSRDQKVPSSSKKRTLSAVSVSPDGLDVEPVIGPRGTACVAVESTIDHKLTSMPDIQCSKINIAEKKMCMMKIVPSKLGELTKARKYTDGRFMRLNPSCKVGLPCALSAY